MAPDPSDGTVGPAVSAWAEEAAFAATREPVEQIRERAAATSGSRILAVTEYELGNTDPSGPPGGDPDGSPP